jgi:hypothetical protein
MARLLVIAVFLFGYLCGTARAQEVRHPVGMVKSVSGAAFVEREGHRMAATPGRELLLGDRVSTGNDGAMGILLRDETAISLGPSTETGIEEFAYEPAEHKLGMVLRVARGVFCYLSGKISKLAPGSVRIETPVATLGVRGTYFVARIAQ